MSAVTIIFFLQPNSTSPTTLISCPETATLQHIFNPNDISSDSISIHVDAIFQLHTILYEQIEQAIRARLARLPINVNELKEVKNCLTKAELRTNNLEY
jgi:hypothetical protein